MIENRRSHVKYELKNITDERLARIALCHLMPSGNEMTGALLEGYGAVQTLRFGLGERPPGYDQTTLRVWRHHFAHYDPAELGQGIELAQRHNLRVLIPGDSEWPSGLNDLDRQAPYALWARGGNPEMLTRALPERATFTGWRAASSHSLFNTDRLATGMSQEGVTVVATSLPGIGRMALASTLGQPGGAIATFAKGLDMRNERLPDRFFDRVAANGMLLSETPPGRTASRDTLRGQLRLLAALSAMTTVVETAPRSEVMKVAAIALNLRRVVGAVPGKEGSIGADASNELLSGGLVRDVTTPADILRGLEAFGRKQAFITAVLAGPSTSVQTATTARSDQLQHRSSPAEIARGPSRTALEPR
ncbi:DNA-processing protein DprA [Leucobacter triazinivorans]|uniref:Smf/DprA SLOG domain-containing protein n=1 Tax=Leucobacter triazinivorans TaxID=1784719 RepID=A0A4P6KEA4_9MICO|nr:DNA-processing protein DprA [Leucobacter triazinivorans]QBE48248.1 hypothetical protein EVS81_04875 [Leucobacter triazinivorans]